MGSKITFAEVAAGRLPDDLTGVRWSDGTIECRHNLSASDYATRVDTIERPAVEPGEVLMDPAVVCDRCADYCS
jgi:hypothetical protein